MRLGQRNKLAQSLDKGDTNRLNAGFPAVVKLIAADYRDLVLGFTIALSSPKLRTPHHAITFSSA